MTLEVKDNQLVLSSHNSPVECKIRIDLESPFPDSMIIGLNVSFVSQAVKACLEECLTLGFNTASSPFIITHNVVEGESDNPIVNTVTDLIMPCQLR